ncbi:MAG: oligosaccharide flippase family protein [Xanthobacteraceae bacterium]
MSVSQPIARSVRITFAATILSGLMQAVIMVVLVRLLGPADYGIYAVAVATTAVTIAFITGTIERTLIVSAARFDLAGLSVPLFLCSVMFASLTLAGLGVLNALGVTHLALQAIAVIFVGQLANGFGTIARVHLRRRLEFGWITVSELSGQFLGTGLVAITLAYFGFGYQALLAGTVVQGVVVMAIMQAKTPIDLVWPVRWRDMLQIGKSALSLGQSSSLEVARIYLPVFIVGRLGDVALGLFNRSYSLVQLPVEVLTSSVNRVAISALVAVSGDRQRLLRASRLYLFVVTAIAFPITAGIAGAATEFTHVIMGEKWLAAIPLVPWLGLAGACLLASRCIGVLGEAMRAFRAKAIIEFTAILVLGAAMLGGAAFGLLTCVIGMGLAGLYYWMAHIIMAARLLNISRWEVVKWHLPALAAATACAGWGVLLSSALEGWPVAYVFAAQISGCGMLSAGYYVMFHPGLVLTVLAHLLPGRRLPLVGLIRAWAERRHGAAG